jgi:hypothetical protein
MGCKRRDLCLTVVKQSYLVGEILVGGHAFRGASEYALDLLEGEPESSRMRERCSGNAFLVKTVE